MSAHLTILYPFIDSSRLGSLEIETVASIVAAQPSVGIEFAHVRRWPASDLGHGVVWLQPDPGEPFRALTRAIWAAFPEAPPYGSPDIDLQPHLTIASDDPAHFDDVESAAADHVPFRRLVTEATLIVEGPQGRWRTEHRFPLG